MSKLSKQIREYVRCPQFDGETEYGEWGALRIDQRRLIRELCEHCDMYEEAADNFAKELKKECEEHEQFVKETIAKLAEKEKEIRHKICEEIREKAQKENRHLLDHAKLETIDGILYTISNYVLDQIEQGESRC